MDSQTGAHMMIIRIAPEIKIIEAFKSSDISSSPFDRVWRGV
jgi:hypothetical protein